MNCERYLDELAEEREAGLPLPAHLRRHLEACPACRRFHESFHRGRAILRSLPSLPPSDLFFDQLQHRIDRWEKRRRLVRRAVGPTGRLVVAGAVAALVYLLAPEFAGRLAGPERARRAVEQWGGPPAVTVLRPFSRLADGAEESLFARPLALATERNALASAAAWTTLARAHVFGGEPEQAVPSGASLYRRQAVPGAPQPVLVATPSWSFAAPPAAFHFVSAHPRPTFPTRAR